MTGERKFFLIDQIEDMQKALADGWKYDPWLTPTGRPHHMRTDGGLWGIYWVMVKGTDEEIMAMNPIYELPVEEAIVVPAGPGYVGLHTVKIPYDKATGKPLSEAPEGYVILHKDHIAATGTVYTKPPTPGVEQLLQGAKNRIKQRIEDFQKMLEEEGIHVGERNAILDELTLVLQIMEHRPGGPWCVECIGVPLTPTYNGAYDVQGHTCPECGRSYPVGGTP